MPGLPLVSMIATNGRADTMVMLGIPAVLNMTFVRSGKQFDIRW